MLKMFPLLIYIHTFLMKFKKYVTFSLNFIKIISFGTLVVHDTNNIFENSSNVILLCNSKAF